MRLSNFRTRLADALDEFNEEAIHDERITVKILMPTGYSYVLEDCFAITHDEFNGKNVIYLLATKDSDTDNFKEYHQAMFRAGERRNGKEGELDKSPITVKIVPNGNSDEAKAMRRTQAHAHAWGHHQDKPDPDCQACTVTEITAQPCNCEICVRHRS